MEEEEQQQSSGEAEVASAGDTLGILSESYRPAIRGSGVGMILVWYCRLHSYLRIFWTLQQICLQYHLPTPYMRVIRS